MKTSGKKTIKLRININKIEQKNSQQKSMKPEVGSSKKMFKADNLKAV